MYRAGEETVFLFSGDLKDVALLYLLRGQQIKLVYFSSPLFPPPPFEEAFQFGKELTVKDFTYFFRQTLPLLETRPSLDVCLLCMKEMIRNATSFAKKVIMGQIPGVGRCTKKFISETPQVERPLTKFAGPGWRKKLLNLLPPGTRFRENTCKWKNKTERKKWKKLLNLG